MKKNIPYRIMQTFGKTIDSGGFIVQKKILWFWNDIVVYNDYDSAFRLVIHLVRKNRNLKR